MSEPYDVAIIGAGVCGLACALLLRDQGIENVILLEAHHAPGGRARAMVLADGRAVDAGAHWFHGGDRNPFFRWARDRYDLGPLLLDTKGEGIEGDVIWHHGSMTTMIELFSALDDAYGEMPPGQKAASSMWDIARALGRADALALVEFMAEGWMAADGGAAAVAARDYFDDPLGPGGWQMQGGGIQRLIDLMVADIGASRVRCGSVVSGMTHDGKGVRVRIDDGHDIRARCVVTTVSPHVLTSEMISFPDEVAHVVARAMSGLSMGNLLKIFVPTDAAFFASAGIAPDTPVCLVDDHAFIHLHSGGEPLAVVFKGGAPSRAMENWDKARLGLFCAGLFDKIPVMAGWRAAVTGEIAATRWGSDRFFGGSYPVSAPGSIPSDPFACGPFFFSGDAFCASNADSPGQMAGAFAAARLTAAQIGRHLSA